MHHTIHCDNTLQRFGGHSTQDTINFAPQRSRANTPNNINYRQAHKSQIPHSKSTTAHNPYARLIQHTAHNSYAYLIPNLTGKSTSRLQTMEHIATQLHLSYNFHHKATTTRIPLISLTPLTMNRSTSHRAHKATQQQGSRHLPPRTAPQVVVKLAPLPRPLELLPQHEAVD